jgi:hypothetical protein
VISGRKINANRANARVSTGPRTAAGKTRSARNAQRHGLSLSVLADPVLAAEVEVLAREIAGKGANAELQQLAARIAEAQIDLVRVWNARNALLSRARLDDQTPARVLPRGWATLVAQQLGKPLPRSLKRAISKSIEEEQFGPTFAACAARLTAMDRYERRALSRRKFAIRSFNAARRRMNYP